jgi:hypothetical protein
MKTSFLPVLFLILSVVSTQAQTTKDLDAVFSKVWDEGVALANDMYPSAFKEGSPLATRSVEIQNKWKARNDPRYTNAVSGLQAIEMAAEELKIQPLEVKNGDMRRNTLFTQQVQLQKLEEQFLKEAKEAPAVPVKAEPKNTINEALVQKDNLIEKLTASLEAANKDYERMSHLVQSQNRELAEAKQSISELNQRLADGTASYQQLWSAYQGQATQSQTSTYDPGRFNVEAVTNPQLRQSLMGQSQAPMFDAEAAATLQQMNEINAQAQREQLIQKLNQLRRR